MISLITISCIMAAFTPILTKKLNKTNVTMSISEISSKCDKFSSDCVLCYPNKCLICNKSCTDGEIKDSEKCSCETCATMYPNCLECKTSGCQKCLSGYGLTADKSCELCPLGYYSDGSTSCKPCPIGKYQDVTGQSTCKSCPIGKYQDVTGQSTCKSCPIGKYQDITGQSSCKSCSAGKYQDVTGQSTCKDCPIGKYQDLEGQSSCKSCSSGYTPNSTKTGCEKTCSCSEKYYSRYFLDEDGKKWERYCSSSCPANYGTEIIDEKGCKTCQVVCPSTYRYDFYNGCVQC